MSARGGALAGLIPTVARLNQARRQIRGALFWLQIRALSGVPVLYDPETGTLSDYLAEDDDRTTDSVRIVTPDWLALPHLARRTRGFRTTANERSAR